MKSVDLVRRSGRNLRQAKVRTVLTALAIAVGGFTLTLTLAASTGAKHYTDKLIAANFDPKSVAVAKDKTLFSTSDNSGPKEYNDNLTQLRGSQIQQLTQQDVSKLQANPHVGKIIEDYQMSAQFITRQGAKRYTGGLKVYNPGQKPTLKAGKVSSVLPQGSVIMPDQYIKLLNFTSAKDALGQKLTVQVQRSFGVTRSYIYTIAAVSTKSALQISFDATGLFLAQSDAQVVNDFLTQGTNQQGKLTAVSVTTKNITPEKLKSELKKQGYTAVTARDAQQFLYQIIDILQIIIIVFGMITLIASFFGVVNTQYISVLERTREIGLMKALGMSRHAVSRLFMLEATWIGFLGAVFGSGLAVIAGTVLNPWISDKLNFGNEHLLLFRPIQIVGLIAFLMLITTLAGLLPARKAAKLDPIEALRTE